MQNDNSRHAQSAYKPLESMPDPILQPERVLWLHVTAQAVIDAASKNKAIRKEVLDWIEDEDFEVVCGAAGVDHILIKALIIKILRDKNRKRAFHLAMKFRFSVRSFIELHTGDIDKDRA
jgi:hypothetical protein